MANAGLWSHCRVPAAGKAGDDVGCSWSNMKSFNDDKRNTEQQDQARALLFTAAIFSLRITPMQNKPCSAMDQFSQQGDN